MFPEESSHPEEALAPAKKRGLPLPQTFASLAYRDFRLLWLGQMGHAGSVWAETVARSWLVWQLTGSPFLLGMLQFTRALPVLAVGLLGGVAADRFNRKKILMVTQSVMVILKLSIALLIVSGVIEVWQVFLIGFLMGIAESFNDPARISLVPQLVERDKLMNAYSLQQMAMNINRVLGPALAGILIQASGVGAAYFMVAGIYVLVLLATALMRVPPTERREKTSAWESLKGGLAYVRHQRLILSLLGLALIPMLFGMPYISLLPIFADKVLGIGARGQGFLLAASGVGALLGAISLATVGEKVRHRGIVAIGGVFFMGVFLAAFASTSWLPLSFLFMLGVGGMQSAFRTMINTLLMTHSPEEMQGRVMSIYLMDRGLMLLGSLSAGLMADNWGAPVAVAVMGGLCALSALSLGGAEPRLRRI